MAPADHLPRAAVEPDRLVMDEPGVGEAREAHQVDMAFLEPVEPGDIARQHAGIRRFQIAPDQRQADARLGPHAEALQHMHMGMAAANQHEILRNRNRVLHDPPLCPRLAPCAISDRPRAGRSLAHPRRSMQS